MIVLKHAWNAVTENTVINCFKHVSFSVLTLNPAVIPEQQPAPADNIFDRLREFMTIPAEVNFELFVEADSSLPTTAGLSDVAILDGLVEPTEGDIDNEIDHSEAAVVPTHKEAIQALLTLQCF